MDRRIIGAPRRATPARELNRTCSHVLQAAATLRDARIVAGTRAGDSASGCRDRAAHRYGLRTARPDLGNASVVIRPLAAGQRNVGRADRLRAATLKQRELAGPTAAAGKAERATRGDGLSSTGCHAHAA